MVVDKPEMANFSWTQLKLPEVIKGQGVGRGRSAEMGLGGSGGSSKSCYAVGYVTPRSEGGEAKSTKSSGKRRMKSNTDSDNEKSVITLTGGG